MKKKTEKTLLERTRLALSNSPESISTIAENSGIGFHWLGKFSQGIPPNPGIINVEKLHNYLSK